jgi:competence protein ComEC
VPPRGCVRSPAFTAFVLLAGGIGLGSSLPATAPLMAATGGALLLLWLSLLIGRPSRRGRLCSLLRAGSAWMMTGAVLALVSGSRAPQNIPCGGLTATVAGVVADPPSRTASGLRFLLHPEWISAGEESLSVRGLIVVTLLLRSGDPPLPVPDYGDRLCMRGLLSEPPGLRNPGEFDLRQYYAASGIRALLLVRGADACCRLPGSEREWLYATLVLPVRRAVLDYIDRAIGGQEGEFLKGLVLGIRSGMSAEMREAFVNAGVAHILAVSGSNVAVIAGFLYGLFLLLRIPGRLRDFCVAAGILYYMVLTGSQPPVVRATIMALIVLAGRRLERPVSAVNSLGVAGLLILLLHPAQLFDVGFQLSFSAVLAIVVLYDRSATLLRGLSSQRRAGRALRAILALAAVSLVATIGTLPLTALHFERVSVIGLLANIVVVPTSGLSVVLGLAGVVSDLLSSWVGEAYAALNVILLHWTLAFTMLAGSSPMAVIHTSGWSVLSSLGIVLALLCLLYLGTPHAGRMLIAALGVWNVALFVPSGALGPVPPGVLRVLFVDVGQGDCALIQFPGGALMAIDVGDRTPRLDQGERTIVPLLRRLGAETMEGIFLTHPHRDHIGGFPAVATSLGVRRTYCSAVGRWPRRWELDPLGAGEFLSPASHVRLYVLWPGRPGQTEPMPSLNGNNGSLVLRLQYGEISFLFTGDIEQPVEAYISSAYGDFLRCTVLKVPHHGAATGCSQKFLSAVAPEQAIISVGTGNRFSHPAPEALERLRDAGARVWRTDCDGAVVFETDGRTIRCLRWKGAFWRGMERELP